MATILSAQCTDERVNQVTQGLFARYPDAAALAGATPETLELLIKPTGFFRSKARSLLGTASALVERREPRRPHGRAASSTTGVQSFDAGSRARMNHRACGMR